MKVLTMAKKSNPDPFETRLRKTGSAAGVTIPAEFLRLLQYEIGDTLRVSVDGDGLQINKIDNEFDQYIEMYESIEDRFLPAFQKLGDSG